MASAAHPGRPAWIASCRKQRDNLNIYSYRCDEGWSDRKSHLAPHTYTVGRVGCTSPGGWLDVMLSDVNRKSQICETQHTAALYIIHSDLYVGVIDRRRTRHFLQWGTVKQ